MSKIKLLISLLTSFLIFSCTNSQIKYPNQKYSLAYIPGEFDGLLLKNYLLSSLKNLNSYDKNSNFEISAEIIHSSNLFITNINNTSDREKIDTNLSIKILDTHSSCNVFEDEITISQYYIFAPSDKFISNQTAVRKIKKDNTEILVRQFIYQLKDIKNKCNE